MEQKSSENKKTIEEVGVDDAPNGGKAAWSVVFGCFCVSDTTFFYIKNNNNLLPLAFLQGMFAM